MGIDKIGMDIRRIIIIGLLVVGGLPLYGLKKVYHTSKFLSNSIVLDGFIDEQAWQSVEWGSNFLQRKPHEGKLASNPTYFKIIYDENYLYVGIKAIDKEPEKIALFNSTRDKLRGDFVEINIDSYFDQRTAFSFSANVAGVQGDKIIYNNGNNRDVSWNPIWYLATNIDSEGWTVEMQIPFDQLRFSGKNEQKWGIQVVRHIYREEEQSCWQFIPQESTGWVHNFGVIYGLENIHPKSKFEFLPYTLGLIETDKKVEDNPFQSGITKGYDIGLDGKIGISSNIIMDFTLNPNFRQIEADPTVINLSALETYYREKRTFFIEGKNITDYSFSPEFVNVGKDNLFYSRRIGRQPQYKPDINDNEFIRQPKNTAIIGAIKLTGKTNNGFSFGILESLTSKEIAEIDSLGERKSITVEPLTNYIVGRLQKDIKQGRTIIGGIFTSTVRNTNTKNLNFLHTSAYTGGLDFYQYLSKDKRYYIGLNSVFSIVKGLQDAIVKTQRSSVRYFQRSDADYLAVDSSLTSLFGHGGRIIIGKNGGSKFEYSLGMTWRSPGLELNDLGYLRRADQILQKSHIAYRQKSQQGIFQNYNFQFWQYRGWDFGGTKIFERYALQTGMQLNNFWGATSKVERYAESFSNHILRGGPSMLFPGKWNLSIYGYTSTKKKINFGLQGRFTIGDNNFYSSYSYYLGFTYRPTETIRFSLSPRFINQRNDLQYYAYKEYNLSERYILAAINQKTIRFNLRFDYYITPLLSIQLCAQPFVSQGKYSNFKLITDAKAVQYNQRFKLLNNETNIYYNENENKYDIDENGDNIVEYSLSNKNFNITDFNMNFIISWEYKPGSQLYFVWTQNRYNKTLIANDSNKASLEDIYSSTPHNVFYIQATYRFTK